MHYREIWKFTKIFQLFRPVKNLQNCILENIQIFMQVKKVQFCPILINFDIYKSFAATKSAEKNYVC